LGVIVENLNFSYEEVPVLQDVCLRVAEGKFTVILGKNGSGKSTLLKLIGGMLKSQSGSIRISGKDLGKISLAERAKLVGYLPQFHQPIFPFTVEEVVLTGRASYIFSMPKPKDREKAYEAMRKVGIEDLRERPYSELSGGERQLVMIARVLAQEPRIILLDEPISHLDLGNQTRFLDLAKGLVRSGMTVLAVLHDPNIAFRYGEDFLFARHRSVRSAGDGESPWDPSLLSDVYGIPIKVTNAEGNRFVTAIAESEQGTQGRDRSPGT
jgi:iron complex transport system ATP-binding protein